MKNTLNRIFRFGKQESALREAIRQADYEIEFGNDPAKLASACAAVVAICEAELEIIERRKQSMTTEFFREKHAWRLGEDQCSPYVIAEHEQKRRRYRQGGLAALLIEAFLSAYVLQAAGYNWFLTVLISVLVTAVLAVFIHGLIKLTTERPTTRESAVVIKKRVVKPSLFVTLPPLAVFLFVRVLSGGTTGSTLADNSWFGLTNVFDWLLSSLSSVFDFALWLATLGLVPLGAGMLSLSELYGFSQQARDSYDQLGIGLAHLLNIKAKYQAVLDRLPKPKTPEPPPPEPPTPPESSNSDNAAVPSNLPTASRRTVAGQPYLMLLLALGLATGLTGCEQMAAPMTQIKASRQALPAVVPPLQPVKTNVGNTKLILVIDHSGSVRPDAATSAASNLYPQVPILVQALNVSKVSLIYFADKAWNAPEAAVYDIPPFVELETPPMPAGHLPPHVLEQLRKRREARLEALRQAAVAQHLKDIQQALAKLDVKALNAATKATARCTDLLGLLSRIGETKPRERNIYLVLTDGVSTCKQRTPVTEPQGEITVMVLLATAVPSESSGQGDTDQYHTRKAALLKVAPWLLVVPANEQDLLNRLKEKRGGSVASKWLRNTE